MKENRHFDKENTFCIDESTLNLINDLWDEATENLGWDTDKYFEKLSNIHNMLLSLVDTI